MMDISFVQWITLTIGTGSLAGIWLWSVFGDWCLLHWKFLCYAVLMEGPPALPIIGNAHLFAGNPDDLLKQITAVAKNYTISFRLWLGTKLVVVVPNPSDIQIVMNHPGAMNEPSECRFTETSFSHGLFTGSSLTHKTHQSLIMSMLNGKALDVHIDSFDNQIQRCVKDLESMVSKGEFDVMPLLDNCTIEIAMNSFIRSPSSAQQNSYAELFKYMNKLYNLAHERTFKVWLHLDCIYFRTQRGEEHKKAVAVVNKFMDDIITEEKKRYYEFKTPNDSPEKSTSVLLEQLVAYNEANKLMDDTRLKDEIFTVFFAAQNTTAHTCTFIFMMLGMHPEIQDKVRNEVQEVVGDENLTVKNLSKLKYLDMVIKETLRLFPVGSILSREAQENIELDTCTAPKGCIITMLIFMIHRDPRFWNEPEKFNPDRFSPEHSTGRHPYAFLPFSGGLRECIGRQYATACVKSLLVRVIQKYRLHSNGSLENLRLKTNITTKSLDGYKISITKL